MRGTRRGNRRRYRHAGIIPACAGNTLACATSSEISRGSSPRVRGTPERTGPSRKETGIIPACAGNTGTHWPESKRNWDHPRVCGEHIHGASELIQAQGSIPACAGNTKEVMRCSSASWDHPRVCGEHMVGYLAGTDSTGSSPRVRGTRVGRHVDYGAVVDHPRVCGEHAILAEGIKSVVGSSPRVRGTPLFVIFAPLNMGIIPACAGNTSADDEDPCDLRDHPRVCGEHRSVKFFRPRSLGSSPRVRGTLYGYMAVAATNGIIPACAGNT